MVNFFERPIFASSLAIIMVLAGLIAYFNPSAASLAAAQRQYRIGAINYLSVLTAQQTYQQARLSLVQAQAVRFADTAALFQALGGGCGTAPTSPAPRGEQNRTCSLKGRPASFAARSRSARVAIARSGSVLA